MLKIKSSSVYAALAIVGILATLVSATKIWLR
jgi:hypothetical protein